MPRPFESIRLTARWLGEYGSDGPPHGQLAWTLSATLAATGAAVAAGIQTSGGCLLGTSHAHRYVAGAGIYKAALVVLAAGVAGAVIALVVSERPRLRVVNLLLVAAALTGAIAVVAANSATSKQITTCSFITTTTDETTQNVSYVYFIWGPAVLALLVQAARDLRLVKSGSLSRIAGDRTE